MRIHYSKINENKRAKKGVLLYVRQFWYLYPGTKDDDRESVAQWHLETVVRKPQASFAARFHVGNAGSETPFDGHLLIFGTGIYWGVSVGRKLAHRLTTSPEHKYDGRDIAIRWGDSRLWVTLWAPNDRWKRGEFRKWRDFNVSVNLLDRIYGQKRYTYKELDWALIAIDMPEGTYAVRATVQEMSHGRPNSKRQVKSVVLDVEAPTGIPTHYDNSGGWKGDRTYGFGVPFIEPREDWVVDAENAIKAWVYEYRGRTGFRQAQEQDAG